MVAVNDARAAQSKNSTRMNFSPAWPDRCGSSAQSLMMAKVKTDLRGIDH
jgi:hypothetical protein